MQILMLSNLTRSSIPNILHLLPMELRERIFTPILADSYQKINLEGRGYQTTHKGEMPDLIKALRYDPGL